MTFIIHYVIEGLYMYLTKLNCDLWVFSTFQPQTGAVYIL